MVQSAASLPRVRTVFISDVHLGYRGCQAELLLDYLRRIDTERLVLVGDIVDLWSLKRSMFWPSSHHDVLRQVLGMARRGVKVIYVPGNHDEGMRELCDAAVEGIEIRRQFIHETAEGRRFLVVHGDEFDGAVKFAGWLKALGEWLYDVVLWLGRGVTAFRRRLGFGYWSLATWLKEQVPDARRYIERFEHAAAHAAIRQGLDGIICGHIHRPEIREVDGVRYCNDGDWVEHCSSLVEDLNGRLTLMFHTAEPRRLDVGALHPVDVPAPGLDVAA